MSKPQKKTHAYHVKSLIEACKAWDAHVLACDQRDELKQLTITFWTVQLSLLELSSYTLFLLFSRIQIDGVYVRNKYTKKMNNLKYFSISEQDRQCLATHLALQLCGIDG